MNIRHYLAQQITVLLALAAAMIALSLYSYGTSSFLTHTILFQVTLLVLLIFALNFNRWLFRIGCTLLVVITAMICYFRAYYGIQITPGVVGSVFEATGVELRTFPDTGVFFVISLAFLSSIIIIYAVEKSAPYPQKKAATYSLIMLLALASLHASDRIFATVPPFNFFHSSAIFMEERYEWMTNRANRTDISKQAGSYTPVGKEPLVVVVAIGESARNDHFSLNGYPRKTNPLLEKEANVVSFPDVTSCGVGTAVSVPCMLTRATRYNKGPMYHETSVISVFNALGFDTAWYSTQGAFAYTDMITTILSEAKDEVVLSEGIASRQHDVYDEDLLPYLDKKLSAIERPTIIFLHTFGSHYQYIHRYPPEFSQFMPECHERYNFSLDNFQRVLAAGHEPFPNMRQKRKDKLRSCDHTSLINEYDNSILYTDFILHEIITRLTKRNALMLYISDHGESLGDQGRYLHLNENAPENWKVPMIFWASQTYIDGHSGYWQAINQKRTMPASHDHVFYSLLGCADIASPLIDDSLNLCNK